MIIVIVVDPGLAKRCIIPVLRAVQRTLQAAATVLKRLTVS